MSDASTQTDKAFQALRTAIVRCELAPGARLRVEELSQRLGVSSSPLREALSRLTGHGLVHAFENRGFRVAPLSVEGLADLTRVRLIVEREALREALAHGDDAWEAGVVAAAHALALAEQRAGGDPAQADDGEATVASVPLALDEDWSARHRAFHLSLYAGARSPTLQQLVTGLFDAAERYRRFSALHRETPRHKHREHQALRNAALARDADRATGLLAAHVSATERNVAAALTAMGLDRAQ